MAPNKKPHSKYEVCAFCGGNDSPKHKEELLAKWIAREYGKKGVWKIKSGQSSKNFRAHLNLGLVSRAPCKRCNNGWLSALERAVKPILSPLFRGTPSMLTTEEQSIITRWFLKTAMMYEFDDENPHEHYFTAEDRKAVMESLMVPPETFVFLAHHVSHTMDIRVRARYVPLKGFERHIPPEGLELPKVHPDDARDYQGYSITFAIGQLAVQLLSLRRPPESKPIALIFQHNWDGATVQIWPIKGSVNWPPRLSLGDTGFAAFTERLGAPIEEL
jgi:hypothetical protein